MSKEYTLPEKMQIAVPGTKIKIIQERDPIMGIIDPSIIRLGAVHTVIPYPPKKEYNDSKKGVYVEGSRGPLLIWFFEFIPYVGLKRTKKKSKKKKLKRCK